MAKTMTVYDELTILKLLAKGNTIDFAAAAVQFPEAKVKELADLNGYPDTGKLGWAADLKQTEIDATRRRTVAGAPITQTPHPRPVPAPRLAPAAAVAPPVPATPATPYVPTTVSQLLAAAAGSHKASTRAKGVRLSALIDDVRKALADETDDRERLAKEKVEREHLEAQAASAEAQLKAIRAKMAKLGGTRKGNSNAAAAATYAAQVFARTGTTRPDLVAWAAQNGRKVATAGLLSRQILDDFEASRG